MGVMSYNQLVLLVRNGVITADKDNINAASIDVTLGDKIMVEQRHMDADGFVPGAVDLGKREGLSMAPFLMNEIDGYVLQPGEFILAHTKEVFNLPNHVSAEYKLKSSMARMGLEHLNAGWCDAGWNGSVLTLELKNMTRFHAIRIRPGDKIGQMIFYTHDAVPPHASYANKGSYNGHATVTGAQPERA